MPRMTRKPGMDKADRKDRRTRLHRAAKDGHHAVVNSLLKAGADIHKGGYEGRTALMEAAFHGHQRVVELLLHRGAYVHKEDKHGLDALCYAAKGGHAMIVEILLNNGFPVNGKGINLGPLHVASNCDVAELLIRRGAYVNLEKTGATPIMTCSNPQVAELLLRHGARITDKDRQNKTPLHYAAKQGNVQMANFFLNKGLHVDATCNQLHTPLMAAILCGSYVMARLLLSKGANVNRTDRKDLTALHLAASNRDTENQVDLFEEIMNAGAVIDGRDSSGNTPLHIAAKNGNITAAKVLIKRGADITLFDFHGDTFLSLASKHLQFDFIQEFLSNEYYWPVSYYCDIFLLLITHLLDKRKTPITKIYGIFISHRVVWERLLQIEDVARSIYLPESDPFISSTMLSEHPGIQRVILDAVPSFLARCPVMNQLDGMRLCRQLHWSARSAYIYLLYSMHAVAKIAEDGGGIHNNAVRVCRKANRVLIEIVRRSAESDPRSWMKYDVIVRSIASWL